MKHILSLAFALLLAAGLFAKPARQTVVLDVDIHCQGCINKIEKNIAFEPGVKDLVCDLDSKTVTLTFDPTRTDLNRLLDAFAKINKPAKLHDEPANTDNDNPEKSENEDVDAQTGASTPQ